MNKLSSIVFDINCIDDVELQKFRVDELNLVFGTNFILKDGKVVYPHITGEYLDLQVGLLNLGL